MRTLLNEFLIGTSCVRCLVVEPDRSVMNLPVFLYDRELESLHKCSKGQKDRGPGGEDVGNVVNRSCELNLHWVGLQVTVVEVMDDARMVVQ